MGPVAVCIPVSEKGRHQQGGPAVVRVQPCPYSGFSYLCHDLGESEKREWLEALCAQYKLLCEPRRQTPTVDFVGRFECLHEDFAHVQQRLGNHHSGLQHLNKTGAAKKDYREHYTQAARKLLADVYEEDIRLSVCLAMILTTRI